MGLLPPDMEILPPTDDRVFRVLMTAPEAKPVLMKLIAVVVGRPVVDVTVHNNELAVSDTQEKAERFDVNCKTDDGSQVNIEMQASRMEEDKGGGHRNFKARIIYFLCDLHSSQPSRGQPRYDRLARTWHVTFCSYTVFPHRDGYMNTFSMRSDEDNELLHDAVRTVIVELSKLGEVLKKPVDAMTDLEKFSVFLEYAADPGHRDIVNEVIESEEVLNVAGNLLMGISQDEKERAIFHSRKKFQMDQASNMATAWDNGMKQKALEVARNALRMNMSIDDIVKLTGLTHDEVESLSTTAGIGA